MNKLLTQAIAEKICKDSGIIRLNLGCGFDKKDGFINIDAVDRFNPDYTCDLSIPLPFPKNSVHLIIATDLFEHFDKYLRYIVMENWANILKIGGKILLQVPNMEGILSLMGEIDTEVLMELIYGENMIASQNYSWHFGNHKWGYTKRSLIEFGRIFGIEFSIQSGPGNINAEGIKTRDHLLNDNDIHIYSFGNDHGIGKPYMSLKEVKDKIHELLP